MRLSIRHHTTYKYETPAEYAAQILRLTPRPYDGFSILSWRIMTKGPGRLSTFEDGFGNTSHMHTVAHVHDAVEVNVEGLVETSDTGGIVRGGNETLPLGAYLRTTPLTFPSAAIEKLATEAGALESRADALRRLMQLVAGRIEYTKGSTGVLTTAADALAGEKGVCQDHAHVFISAARALGIPARYVGGYLCMDGQDAAGMNAADPVRQQAGHAWAEAYDGERGWTAFDPANNTIAGAWHVRTSVGLDYSSAAPVRGVRRDRGGICGAEFLSVDVQVSRISGQ
ncbi:MAG TPA: transglutaminase family protein [Candidatus Limnocylindrales bacterium]|nr:transglutaminase family protein [Candidatus Limnocylindrales bacterium]